MLAVGTMALCLVAASGEAAIAAPAVHLSHSSADAGEDPPAPGAAAATVLTAARAALVNGRVQITLHGNGRLEPSTVEVARDLPPRVFLDFEGVGFKVAPVIGVNQGDVLRIRVAANSVSPPVTRVVIDLSRPTRYDLTQSPSGDLVISLGEAQTSSAPAAADTAAASAPPIIGLRTLAREPIAAARGVASVLAGSPVEVSRATLLTGVRVEVVAGRVEVSLRGNGRLEPSAIEFARDLPPRLLLDLPGVRANVAPSARVARGDVRGVRVATNSLTPLVTRVVFDLARHVPFEVSRRVAGGDEFVVALGGEAVSEPRAVATLDAARDDGRPRDEAPAPSAQVAEAAQAPVEAIDSVATSTEPAPEAAPALEAAPEGAPAAAPAPLQWAAQGGATQGNDPPTGNGRRRGSKRQSTSGAAPGARPGLIQLRSLRTAFGVGYDLVGTSMRDGRVYDYSDRLTSPIVSVQGGLSIVDPRFLAIDGWADLRFNWRAYTSDALDSATHDTLQNYRVNFLVLSGKPAPLSIYVQRVDLFLDQRQNVVPAGNFLELTQSGVQTSRGFTWDVTSRRLPHIVATGDITDRSDAGSFLAGWDSRSRQERLELRADKASGRAAYEASFSHERSRYDYPAAQISSDYAIDFLRGSTSVRLRPGLVVDGGARATRYGFTGTNLLQRQRDLMSAGGFGGLQWTMSPRWRASARYSATSNETDVALGSAPGNGAPEGADVATVTARRRFLYQDYDARVSFTPGSGATVASVFTRGLSLDPVAFVTPTLSTLRMVGAQVDTGRQGERFDAGVGGSAAVGRSSSNQGDTQPYTEVAGWARAGWRFSRGTVSANGGLRWNDGSYFYPVGGRASYGNVETTLDVTRELRVRASAGRSFLLRDVVFQRGDDRTDAFSLGVSGSRYDLVADYADTRSSAAGLLEATLLLEPRPDLALAAHPELFGFLYASRQVLRGVSLRMTLVPGLDVFGRGRLDRIERPGPVTASDLDQTVAQLGALWSHRQLRAEVGWEYIESRTFLVSSTNRRFYARLRRDVPLF